MSSSRYQKKFTFAEKDRDWIADLFKQRDEEAFPTESDLLVFILRSHSGVGTNEEKNEVQALEESQMQSKFANICPTVKAIHPGYINRGVQNTGSEFLDRIGRYFVCLKSRGGKVKYFKVDSKPMTLDEVKRICARCRDPWSKYRPVEGSDGYGLQL